MPLFSVCFNSLCCARRRLTRTQTDAGKALLHSHCIIKQNDKKSFDILNMSDENMSENSNEKIYE